MRILAETATLKDLWSSANEAAKENHADIVELPFSMDFAKTSSNDGDQEGQADMLDTDIGDINPFDEIGRPY